MEPGQTVNVRDFSGKLLKRKVVEVIGDVVLICKEEEYNLARQSKSLPFCVGFRKEDVSASEIRPSKVRSS